MVLATLGQHNQQLYSTQDGLLITKSALQREVVDLRAEEAAIISPAAVRAWAYARDMVASPEGQEATLMIPVAPPQIDPLSTESVLEFRTLWR